MLLDNKVTVKLFLCTAWSVYRR